MKKIPTQCIPKKGFISKTFLKLPKFKNIHKNTSHKNFYNTLTLEEQKISFRYE